MRGWVAVSDMESPVCVAGAEVEDVVDVLADWRAEEGVGFFGVEGEVDGVGDVHGFKCL